MEDIQFNNKINVIIIGAGSLAREILSWIQSNKNKSSLNVIGFLDDEKNNLLDFSIDIPVLGDIKLDIMKNTPNFIIGMIDTEFKEQLYNLVKNQNLCPINYLHESVLLGSRIKFGEGLVMLPNSIVSCDVTIGHYVFINNGSHIGHDVTIGDFTSVMAGVDIGGGAQIGNKVFIGSKAVILPGVKIPDNTRIGAGSVVLKSIKQPGTYFGNPAKKIF